jgi:3-oxoacyl-[acyl-carrier-protein] synthase I
VLCDLNGESYRAFEWGVVAARLGDRGALERLVHPAVCLGDIGAATFGVLTTAVAAAFRRGYAAADEAIIWTSSDGPARAAARIARA